MITDLSDPRNANRGTLLHFIDRGSVKSIAGVHAKIYIFDKRVIVTSANLTETAFTKRREIGTLLDSAESAETIKLFELWWNLALDLTTEQITQLEQKANSEIFPEPDGEGLPTLWALPDRPPAGVFAGSKQTEKASNYRQFLSDYGQIASIYKGTQRLWAAASLFLEVDAFLNFLFHDADDRPSFAYWGEVPKSTMGLGEREYEIRRRAENFADWCSQHSEQQHERLDRLITVQRLLKREHIGDLSWEEVRAVADRLHAMGARKLNKYKFTNGKNNTIEAIRSAWKKLLFDQGTEDERIKACDDSLRFFGPSSIQELLGCFYPEQYPLRNSNSDSGLKYFGFDV